MTKAKFKKFMVWYWKLTKQSLITQMKAYAILFLIALAYGKYLQWKDKNVLEEK